jgi:hypothetical protein
MGYHCELEGSLKHCRNWTQIIIIIIIIIVVIILKFILAY